jgi:hypothetical protein
LGCITLLDFRLLGIGARHWTPGGSQMNCVISYVGLVVILVTGWLLFMAEPMNAYDNIAFLPKMAFLVAAITFHYTIFSKASSIDKVYTSVIAKFAALVSLTYGSALELWVALSDLYR